MLDFDRVTREVFWNVGLVWFFYLLAALAVGGFALGAYRNLRIWLKGWREKAVTRFSEAVSRTILDGFLNRRIFNGDFVAGLMHLSIMWGFIVLFIGTVLLTIHHDLYPFLFGLTYLAYSLILDIAGLVMIVGVLIALTRRYVTKPRPMHSILDDGVVLILLLGIGLTGFAIEGFRLATLQPAFNDWSPIGSIFAAFFDKEPAAAKFWHSVIWWTHAVASLGLVVYIPVSKLFHMFASPANIYCAVAEPTVVTVEERDKFTGEFSRQQLISLDACTKCNRCENVCPSYEAGEPLSPRHFVLNMKAYTKEKYGFKDRRDGKANGPRTAQEQTFRTEGAEAAPLRVGDFIENDESWWCTACRACVEECPVAIRPMDIIKETRIAMMADGRKVPPTIRDMLRTMSKHSNPWEAGGSKRVRWRKELGVKDYSEGDEAGICYWISCIASEDLRNQEVIRSFVELLKGAGVDFAHLGKEEACCGEFIRRLGEDGLFEAIVERNYATFSAYGITNLVTTSPHCFHAMKRDYPQLREKLHIEDAPDLQVRHHTEFILEQIKGGKLSFSRKLEKRVTFHDPCFIGRHNGLYDQPREVLKAIPGIELVEMPRSRENSFCCGGGGGRMWLESKSDRRMAEIRMMEAAKTGADILVTACPFCMSNLHDAAKTAGLAEQMEVKDIAEVVAEGLGLHDEGKEDT